ncbi:hypothetical protein KKB44_03765 [Candidatus Micrarchaeota archaeon]|nr:hypothetical protein [Candidatus Micrarchaeota archaeon]
MDVKILVKEKNVLELELGTNEQSLAQVLAERLNQDSDVEFAAYKLEHPIASFPRLIVKTKKGDPSKLLLEKLKEIKKEITDFRKQFADIVK